MNCPIRILIADSDIKFSRCLQKFLDRQEGIKVIDTVRDGQGAVDMCREGLPDLVLMDLRLPVLDSIRAVQTILAQNDRIKILGLTTDPNDRYAVEVIKVGASGCLDKNQQSGFEEIVKAIYQVEKGEVLLSPNLASSILQEFHRLSK
jgi:DNA-binding NarL/FixJ family response regulator